jgi:hypothetical protein
MTIVFIALGASELPLDPIDPNFSKTLLTMKTHFKNPHVAPVTATQLERAGVDPSDFYWSGTFQAWRFCGAVCLRFPYQTTGAILAALNITPNPQA